MFYIKCQLLITCYITNQYGRGKLIVIIDKTKYIQCDASNSIMGMEVLIVFCTEENNGKILNFNNELGGESYLNAIAIMWTYFIITLNIIHHNPYDSIKAKEPLHQMINHFENTLLPYENRELPSVLEQLIYIIYHLTAFIYKNSFISLIIVMMVSLTLY